MNRATLPLIRHSAALIALAAAVPLAAQATPGGSFSLPQPTPTPTPAPAGPADEVAGVAIPPRSVEQPRIAPAPVLEPEASPSPRPTPLRPAPARPAASPAATPAPTATSSAPAPANTQVPVPVPLPAPEATPLPGATPGFEAFTPSAEPAPGAPPSEALGNAVLDWRWLAAGALLLATLLGGWLLWRRRKPKVLRLAAPVVAKDEEDAEPVLPRIDISVEIPGASRSVMTFTLRYRINLANRTDRAVNDLAVAVQVTTARQGQSNAAPLAAAQNVTRVERIGPHQSRSVTGEVQLPFAGIAPVMQGRTMLFIPLLHVTLEGEGQQALARSFVIGTPGATEGRVQPLRMDMLPGSAPDLRARAIEAPPPSA
ncbi:MAG: hypothetical protein O9266_13375 [Porphyrobacter sp.]|jgi:hypothetical protein|nr:hypothetical protein [Porphyrobacter sp.]